MNLSGMFTTALSVMAAWQGVRGAPAATSQRPLPDGALDSPLPLANVENRLPPELLQSLEKNYGDCRARMKENRRLFGGHTEVGKQALCVKTAGRAAGFSHALKSPPSELPIVLHGLKRIDYSDSRMPLPELNTADYPDKQLLRMNFNDYRVSGSTHYAQIKASHVALLRKYVPEDQRGSIQAARKAASTPDCVEALEELMQQSTRQETSERIVLLNMRSVGMPQTLEAEDQLYDLAETLKEMEFGDSAMKRRMLNDALKELVAEHHAARA